MDLDEAADRLYGLVPGEFTTARDALAKEARAAGDAELARGVRALRRPTVVAWAVNQASRRRPQELEELLDVGRRLREAWRSQDADALAALGRERSAAIARLARVVRQDAESAGQPLAGTADMELEQTLDAAVVDDAAAARVREGRLVRGLSYSGFAPAPVVRPAPGQRGPAKARPPSAPEEAGKRPGSEAEREAAARERREAERERRVRELDRELAEARRAAGEAERSHADWEAELAEAGREHERRGRKAAELAEKLARAKEKLDAAGHRLDVAKREEAAAARAARSARLRAEQAESARRAEDP
ncbi:hypothetical protein [Microbispora sp. NPDC049125]|uniref:hypothetical protein n=1 Tax=Microbispora sp. NPDC049125 TaxID=3154929 RepID=UPI0034679C66